MSLALPVGRSFRRPVVVWLILNAGRVTLSVLPETGFDKSIIALARVIIHTPALHRHGSSVNGRCQACGSCQAQAMQILVK